MLRSLETFDEDASPLQKGMLDARDKKWSKKVKLGTDPRCRRVVREFARRAGAKPRLCLDPVGDKNGTFIGQDACLEKYCCDEDDCPAKLCANALIGGGDTSLCFDGALVQAAGNNKTCIDEIFKRSEGNRNVDCLEDPFTTKDGDTYTLKPKCKKLFEGEGPNPAVCEDLAPARKTKKWGTENGKGKRIQTRTVIHYRQPKERKDLESGGPDAWDEIDIRAARSSAKRKGVPGSGPQLDKQLSAGGFNIDCNPLKQCDENEDGDCYDRITGEHMRGDACFDGGYLRSTLAESATCSGDVDTCCTHTETGEELEGDDCLPETVDGHDIRTTLFQLVDEDPPDDSLNNDGDCCLESGNGCGPSTITSDCLDEDGLLREGYQWNVDEETSCAEAATNLDNDCMVVLEETDDCQPTCPDMVCDGDIPSPCRSHEDCQGGNCVENTNCPGEAECHRGETVIGYLGGNGACVLDWRQGGMTVTSECDPDSPVSPCWTALVGEDCPESIDNDGDERVDEDGPTEPSSLAALALVDDTGDMTLARETEACTAVFARFGISPDMTELPNEEHGCKIDRLMRLEVNRKLRERCDAETQEVGSNGECTFETRSGGKKKLFDVDEDGKWCSDSEGNCDENDRGAVHPGNAHQPKGQSKKYEERQVSVDEVFGIQCKPIKIGAAWQETDYDPETGNCIVPAPAMLQRAAAELGTGWEDTCDSEMPPDECFQAMMGFTFAPPVIEWGWRIETEACLFGYCFEIFFARVGYEFDLAAGVRLPVQIDFDSLPDSVLATEEFSLDTTLEPLDFDVDQYRRFCELHALDEPWYISDCDRFSFPDFLDARDGDEFVLHSTIFAGLVVRALSVPIINWAVDSSVDVPAMCTAWKMKDGIEGMTLADMVKIQLGLFETEGDVLKVLKDNLGNCGSFTTPFGMKECEPWECTTGERLRGWPFLSFSKWIRADCLEARIRREVVTIGKKEYPICTGLTLGYAGASLGVGLGVETNAGSKLIRTEWSAASDAIGSGTAEYRKSANEDGSTVTIGPVTADNRTETGDFADHALLQIGTDDAGWFESDGFTYYLNALEIALNARLEFGGILTPIPDIGSFTLYNFVLDFGDFGLPVPQHPGTDAVTVKVEVDNYALELDIDPAEQEYKPGCDLDGGDNACPDYRVGATNHGTETDSFVNFEYQLSNRQQLPAGCDLPLEFDSNNDHDCEDSLGNHRRGTPSDGMADECFDECGQYLLGVVPLVDEDPGDGGWSDNDGDGLINEDGSDDNAWEAKWYDSSGTEVPVPILANVPAHSRAADEIVLRVRPLTHPFTTPGAYPFRVLADSQGAVANDLTEPDPLRYYRLDAPIDGLVQVLPFYEPQTEVQPETTAGLPGSVHVFTVGVLNQSNAEDTMNMSIEYLDFNQAGCTLVTLGNPGCPYRGVPTAIPGEWIADELESSLGPLEPATTIMDTVEILVPAVWAGMGSATYSFRVTAQSAADPVSTNLFEAQLTVEATFESMTRYIGLEVDTLIGEIEAANAAGIDTAGLLPIATNPIRRTWNMAFARLLEGNAAGAVRALGACIKTTEAFLHALEGSGKSLPEAYSTDWRERAYAIIRDLNDAVARGSGG